MPKFNDTSKSPVALDQNSTLIAVIEMSQDSWLVAVIMGSTPTCSSAPLSAGCAVSPTTAPWRRLRHLSLLFILSGLTSPVV